MILDREIRIDSEGTEALSVAEVRSWGKIPGTAEDALIERIIKSVRQLQEQWTGRSFIEKTITAHWDRLDDLFIPLPYGPIRSITSIKRVYEDGTLSDTLVSGTDYYIRGMDFKTIALYKRWQSAGQIVTGLRVEYTAGHGSGSGQVALPEPIRQAMLRHIDTDFQQRDDLEIYQPVLYDWTKEALQTYKIDNLWL